MVSQVAVSRYVSYSLQPGEAERVLATLSDRPRLLEDKWLALLGPRAQESYQIRNGDNLWSISSRLFGNPFYWSKLWEMNPSLTNPHELEKGSALIFYRAGLKRGLASEEPSEIKIPLIKLLPERKGGVADIDQDAVFNVDIKNRFRPRFFILTPETEVYGTITGTYAESEVLNQHKWAYVKASSENIKVGTRYAIIHEEKPLRDQTQDDAPLIGNLVQTVGELQIVEVGEKLLKAEVTALTGTARRGDKLIDLQSPVNFAMRFDPPSELQAQIVMGEEPDYHLFVQGQLVLVNKGRVDGMKEGFLFRVWRDTDLHTGVDTDVEPESKGEVQIVHVGTLSSVGFILRNIDPLKVGDTLVPRQVYSNPPSFAIRMRETREIK